MTSTTKRMVYTRLPHGMEHAIDQMSTFSRQLDIETGDTWAYYPKQGYVRFVKEPDLDELLHFCPV